MLNEEAKQRFIKKMKYPEDFINQVICGDCLEVLKTFPDESVDCVITSPPYWGLRDYGVSGQFGLEKTPEEYVAKMVEVFREVKRVLKKEGIMFLNLGDSYAGNKEGNTETFKNPRLVSNTFNKRVPNFADFLKRRFEEGIFFFGSSDPRGSSTESIHILIYDKRSPDLVFKPFFSAKRVSIKNGQYDFCEVGGFLNAPVNCWISSSLHLTLPNHTNTESFLDIPDYIGIIITAGNLDSDSALRTASANTIKNSKTSFPIKITREPITKSGVNDIFVFDTFAFHTGSKGISQVHAIDKSVSLLDSSKFFASGLGDFRIRETSEEKLSLSLHNGTDICFLGVRHNLFVVNNGLTPYYSILDKANKRKNYFQAKQEIGIPFLVRQALMEDGWICRQTIIWHKPNPMPESVNDRCTKSHEYIFLLAKSQKYYFDNEAIKEKAAFPDDLDRPRNGRTMNMTANTKKFDNTQGGGGTSFKGHSGYYKQDGTPISDGNRNKRSVWTITTKPFKEAHFATFPEDLIVPMVKAGCPKGGIILDPFMGAGTTALVAQKLGRKYLGIELNPAYIKIAENRLRQEILL